MNGPPEPGPGPEPPDGQTISRRSAVIAGHTGDVATARAAWDADDPKVRASAVAALDRMGALTDADLRAAQRDPSPTVRMRAAALSARHPSVSPAALLDDPSDAVVEVAAWACGEGEAPEPTTVARLAAVATDHANPLVREAAVAALGAIGHPAGLEAILAATTDRAVVRRRAVLALAPFDGPEVDAALRRAAQDKDWQTRDAAELLLEPD
ncbi:HEAT repeat domain-containing protein [Candidatus Poriferisocius sp.]|uniref:HEAT repeat domain-containing protein n=1 Tax=Candidatus Poriferisocius sp. TaxID=3101276 RepID=UPI003B58B5B9